MPIDSVSSAMPAAPSRSLQLPQRAKLCALSAAGRAWAEGSPSSRAARDPATPPLRGRAPRPPGRDAALAVLPLEVDLQADLQRRQAGGTGLAQTPRDLEPVDAVHPVEALGDEAGLVALDRSDEMPLDRPGPRGSPSCRAPPGHSSRRMLAARPPRRRARRAGQRSCLPRPGARPQDRGRPPAPRLDAGEDCLQRLWDGGHNARVSGHRICLLLCPPRLPVR